MLIKARQFAELLAQSVAARTGLLLVPGEMQLHLLERLVRAEELLEGIPEQPLRCGDLPQDAEPTPGERAWLE